MQETGKYYVINDLVMFTGLTDRTIRNYISAGMLEGEKVNGQWQFAAEQVDAFVRDPAVRQSVLAKNNSLVYDFLLEDKKKNEEVCVILDTPHIDKGGVAKFFSNRISDGDYHNIKFSFDGVGAVSRVILKGDVKEVLQLINEFQVKYN